MLDQSSPRDENLSIGESNIELTLIDSATHGHTGPSDADAISDCTRISLEADRPEQHPDEEPLIVVQQDSLDDQTMVNNTL